MLHLADTAPALRQTLATGRVSERLTGRGLTAHSGSLFLRADAGPLLPVAARYLSRSEGYFAFSILPDRDMPDLSAATDATLRAVLQTAASAPLVSEVTVPANTLLLVETPREVGGQMVTLRRIGGAPVDLSVAVDPAAVALQGIVLRTHDPAEPIAGITVAVGAASTSTDAAGRFFLPTLPLLAEIEIALTEGATTTVRTIRVDYARPVNSATLSLPV